MEPTDRTGVELELFLRGGRHGTRVPQDAMSDRARKLRAGDAVDECSVHRWPARVCDPETGGSERCERALERFERFEAWADRTGLDVEPFFERRTVSSAVLDEEYEAVVFPVACLAVYGPDGLWTVTPCTDGETNYSVEDCLEALENGEAPVPLPRPERAGLAPL